MPDSVNFDRAAEFYDATRGFAPGEEAPVIRFIAETGDLSADSRVLEIGVGTGRIAVPLSAYAGTYFGIDISTGMMGKLRQKPGGEHVRLAEANALHLPFASSSLDVAVVVHVFHLVADAMQVARELARVLKPDGVVLDCRGGFGDGLEAIRDAWMASTANNRIGTNRWAKVDTLLVDEGWTEIARRTHSHPATVSPRDFLDRAEKRSWSSTWRMGDDELAQGVAAIHQAIDEHFNGDADAQIPSQAVFHVTAYRPPQV